MPTQAPPRVEIPKDAWTAPANVHPNSVAWRLVRSERDSYYGDTLRTYARDGIEVSHDAHGQVTVSFEKPYRSEQVQGTLDEVLARLDQDHPAPFPGLREGQIWWWPERARASTLRAAASGGWTSSSGASPITLERMAAACESAVLLHDPLQPECAPWSRRAIVRT